MMKDIQIIPIKTHNDNNDRFVLSINNDGSVYYYDNHKRDGYGLLARQDSKFSTGEVYSENNFKELFKKLNELYLENQALKNNDKYHQIVMDKFNKEIEEFEGLAFLCLERDDKDTWRYYHDIAATLEDIRQHTFQGEEYE